MSTTNYELRTTNLRRSLTILFILSVLFSTTGFSCTFFQDTTAVKEAQRPITLNVWGVFDDGGSFSPLFDAYHAAHSNVTVQYRKFRFDEYEQEILNALAEDRGPDIISFQNNWTDRYAAKLLPMPQSMRTATLVTKGTFKKVTTAEVHVSAGYTSRQIRDNFLDVVGDDVLRAVDGKESILGLPFSVDVLSLFYNKTLQRNTGVIIAPPQYWAVSDDDPQGAQKRALFQDFVSQVEKLTVIDPNTSEIIQSGAAFGAAKNIQRFGDILETLMIQNGSQMQAGGGVNFDYDQSIPRPLSINPGVDAVRFYTDFASPVKKVYTWNEDMPDSFEAFAQGRTAMFFGYSYHAQQLKARAPQLRYGIAPIPQINPAQPAVIANYWVYGVSKKTQNADYAWDFLRFATQPEVLKKYLVATKKPTPLKSLIEEQKQDPDLEAFVSQLLFARSWYHGKNSQSMENALATVIADALTIKGAAIDQERSTITQSLQKATEIIRNGWQ